MKKTYHQPSCLVAVLGTKPVMLTESLTINTDTSDEENVINNSGDILTKGNKSVWDNEW